MNLAATFLLSGLFLIAPLRAAEPVPVDAEKMKLVPVVLRVRRVSAGEGSKYLWPTVEVLQVIKNDSNHRFPKMIEVAHHSVEPGLPRGISTIYLERYDPDRDDLWRLLGNSGVTGVSHQVEP